MNRIMKKNIVFISWHSDKQEIGKKIAKCFRKHFENIFGKDITVFESHVDIKHGWTDELSKALDDSKYGIMLLTPQALDSAWMYYEYGVLRRTPEHVWCFSFGNVNRDKTPFAINQYLEFNEEELNKMLDTIVKKELADNFIGWDECISIRQQIEIEVPKLYSEVNKIAVNIDNGYERNYTIREKYYDLLKNGNDAETSQKIANLTSDNNSLRNENQTLKTNIQSLQQESKSIIQEYERKINDLNKLFDDCTCEIDDLNLIISRKNEFVNQKDAEIARLNARIIQLESEVKTKYCNVIDLGLPSGTLWADRNIGASSPEEYGDYFAWGEIEPKDGEYTWDTYKYKDITPKTLPSDHDAATANWCDEWQMPTKEQFDELLKYCGKPEWKTFNGKNGAEFKSRKNGKTIFFPAAGAMCPFLEIVGSGGDYWSSSVCDAGQAWSLDFSFGCSDTDFNYRKDGFSVRAVRCKN